LAKPDRTPPGMRCPIKPYWSRGKRVYRLSRRPGAAGRGPRCRQPGQSNAYYDPALKGARLNVLRENPRFSCVQTDLVDRAAIASLFAQHRFAVVVHLAAQAGRGPLDRSSPRLCRCQPRGLLQRTGRMPAQWLPAFIVCAVIVGLRRQQTKVPFSVDDKTNHPVSFHAATKGQRDDGLFV
jgi:hypothetical protein